MHLNLGFVGFGTVGQGLLELLVEKQKEIPFEWVVTGISDLLKGSIYDENGLNSENVLSTVKKTGKIDTYPAPVKGWNATEMIKKAKADIIVEVSYTDIETGEPAVTHVKDALNNGKHVVTSNKGPLAVSAKELMDLAKEKGLQLRYEGTVMSGTPSILLCERSLKLAGIREVRGILNGTTNYILTKMASGETFSSVLKEAQDLGYAEAKPDADVEGWDAVGKVIILANTVMGGNLKVSDVKRQGITHLTPEDVEKAKSEGLKWKLIASVKYVGNTLIASVRPEKLPSTDPLYSIDGVTNALSLKTDALGDITLVGPGAGRKETGFALLLDIVEITKSMR